MATPPELSRDTADAGTADRPDSAAVFTVRLSHFSGPFDLLLSLIAKHQLDITEVALAQVTDEFVAMIRTADDWTLDAASEFLVIAATLLDLKAARLLPATGEEDPEDLELLEARDLLFARLLQYRAYKQIAAQVQTRLRAESRWFPRAVSLEPSIAAMLPDLVWTLGTAEFAALATAALAGKPAPERIDLSHLHSPAVSVAEQAAVLVDRLRQHSPRSFRSLVSDAGTTVMIVARFLALLELYRDAWISFDQQAPWADLSVRWTGPRDDRPGLPPAVLTHSDFDGGTQSSDEEEER